MLDYFRREQLDVMLFLSGVCAILVPMTWVTNTLSRRRKRILTLLETAAALLLIFDRNAYLFRGDTSAMGYWMVRIANFMVYALQLYLLRAMNLYLRDLFSNELGMESLPRRLRLNDIFFFVDFGLLVFSRFVGLYYTFDAANMYHRAAGMPLSYVLPLAIIASQLSLILQYRHRISRGIFLSLFFNGILPLAATVLQFFAYGLSLTNITSVGMVVVLYMMAFYDLNKTAQQAKEREIKLYQDEEKRVRRLFEQTAEALATAIDAKDRYTRGHSARVAEYSRRIAQAAGQSDEDCDKVFFAGLLHDVGKIGVSDAIITKDGRLTDEEFSEIRQHPVHGNNILSRISESPYLSVGAHFHHERYDGRGYPVGLKGEDIPEIARIIAVADSYDAMTSKRSYRDPLPQEKVREEIFKGLGTQFDPDFGRIMISIIDQDTNYEMKEDDSANLARRTQFHCGEMDSEHTEGLHLNETMMRVSFYSQPDSGFAVKDALPCLVIFDALDGRMHLGGAKQQDFLYYEYARIRLDGEVSAEGVRRAAKSHQAARVWPTDDVAGVHYGIEAVRVEDHALLRVTGPEGMDEIVLALPDSSRFAYLAITGAHCTISRIHVDRDDYPVPREYIARIAPRVSYIEGCPQGDLANVQIDGWRSDTTGGVPLVGDTVIRFHSQSLPTARLVWHCPFICIFTSANGLVDGDGFREYALVRLDGETWSSDEHAENHILAEQTARFPGWNAWKEQHRKGLDVTVNIRRVGNEITLSSENLGLGVQCRTEIKDEVSAVYAAITGDQCAVTNIQISHAGQ